MPRPCWPRNVLTMEYQRRRALRGTSPTFLRATESGLVERAGLRKEKAKATSITTSRPHIYKRLSISSSTGSMDRNHRQLCHSLAGRRPRCSAPCRHRQVDQSVALATQALLAAVQPGGPPRMTAAGLDGHMLRCETNYQYTRRGSARSRVEGTLRTPAACRLRASLACRGARRPSRRAISPPVEARLLLLPPTGPAAPLAVLRDPRQHRPASSTSFGALLEVDRRPLQATKLRRTRRNASSRKSSRRRRRRGLRNTDAAHGYFTLSLRSSQGAQGREGESEEG